MGHGGVLLLCLLPLLHAHGGALAAVMGLRRHRLPGFTAGAAKPACDIFSGSWVVDRSYPLYEYSACSLIDPEFNCQLFGRPDSGYLRFRWQPSSCNLPRFDGLDFLSKMRGKTVMFVGDSLGRNQWESLICTLHAAEAAAQSPSLTQLVAGDPLSTYNFLDYGVNISFYRAPYLVDIDVVQGKRVLRLDDISVNGEAWVAADVLSFNSGHWWTHKGALQGWDYMADGGAVYQDMDRLVAFQRGLTTWTNWIDLHIDRSKTRVLFQSISPTHYNSQDWGDAASKNCYGETSPAASVGSVGSYSTAADQMRVVEGVVKTMSSPAFVLDITALSELRPDAHPSIYSGDLSAEQRAEPNRSAADCSHWCLPGVPDTWNLLFYASLFSDPLPS